MKSELVNPFIEATVETFDTMCEIRPVRNGALSLLSGVCKMQGLVCLVGLSGKARGAVLLTMPIDVGKAIASKFLGEDIPEVNEDLLDALGEIVNIIAGAAAAKLEGYAIQLSLPTVLVGRDQLMGGSEASPWVVIPMRLPELGDFNIEVSMEEV